MKVEFGRLCGEFINLIDFEFGISSCSYAAEINFLVFLPFRSFFFFILFYTTIPMVSNCVNIPLCVHAAYFGLPFFCMVIHPFFCFFFFSWFLESCSFKKTNNNNTTTHHNTYTFCSFSSSILYLNRTANCSFFHFFFSPFVMFGGGGIWAGGRTGGGGRGALLLLLLLSSWWWSWYSITYKGRTINLISGCCCCDILRRHVEKEREIGELKSCLLTKKW